MMPNKRFERKLKAGHGPCLRKSRARLSIPLNRGVMRLEDKKIITRSGFTGKRRSYSGIERLKN